MIRNAPEFGTRSKGTTLETSKYQPMLEESITSRREIYLRIRATMEAFPHYCDKVCFDVDEAHNIVKECIKKKKERACIDRVSGVKIKIRTTTTNGLQAEWKNP